VEAAVEKEEKFVKRILKKGDKETIPKPKDSVKVKPATLSRCLHALERTITIMFY
jgi:hypothetical protein